MNKKRRKFRIVGLLITLYIYALAWTGPAVAGAGGVIDEDTHWTLDDSPVLVESTVVVTADAQLVISPGVVVAFSEGTSLEIEEGALYAKGTVQAPILFTSANDLEGQPATAGDWGSIVLGPGTRVAGTLLENLEVRYGHGIQVEGSSPRLNHILLEHNAGAAIDLDLGASPTGVGLVALNNDINGIRVPAGQITGDVVWALRGIPYVVEQGRVRVGRPDYSILPQEITLAAGVTAELELVIPEAAPPGGLEIDLTSSVPGVLQTEPSATVPEGGDRASFTVEAVAVGHSVVSASHPALGLAAADIHVVAAPALAVSPLDPRVGIGESLQFDIALSEPAGVGGLTISLEADPVDVIDVPEQVFIAEGTAAAQFSVTGIAHGMTMLHLEAEGYLPVSTTVEVVPPSIELPGSIYVAPGVTRSVPIGLSHPAPAGGLEIQLEANEPGVFDVQSSVGIAAGELTGQFEVTGISAGQTGLTASAEGFAVAEATVVVGELTLRLGPDEDPWLPVGIDHAFSVHSSDVAPPGGLTVEVSVDESARVGIAPVELYIPPGQTQATESLNLSGLELGDAILTLAFEGGQPRTYTVRVTESLEVQFSRAELVIGRDLISPSNLLRATLWSGDEQYFPYANIPLALVCEQPVHCQLYGSAIVPAGQSFVNFRLRGGNTGETRLLVDNPGITVKEDIIVTVVDPQLLIQTLAGTRSVGSVRDGVRLRWFVPGAPSAWTTSSVLAEDRQVQVSIVDDDPAGLIDGIWNSGTGGQLITEVTFPAGSSVQSNIFHVGTPTAPGTYRVRVAVDDLTETVSVEQVVLSPELAFRWPSVVAGKDLVSSANMLTIQRLVNGSGYNGSEPLEVALQCVDVAVCSVPETVVIPAGQSTAGVRITGIGTGVTPIEASADGHADADPVSVEVVDPQLLIQTLAGTRSVGSVRDGVRLRWFVPGAPSAWTTSSVLAEDRQVQVSIVDDDPAGLIDGIWNSGTGGQLITEVTFPAGSSVQSNIFHVGTPTAPGTYRVRVAVDDLTETVSAQQIVVTPELTFSSDDIVTASGMATSGLLSIQRRAQGQLSSTFEPVTVSLSCGSTSVCQVPATVTIPANSSSVTVPVTGIEPGATTIIASAVGHEPPAPLFVTTVRPRLYFYNFPASLSVGSTGSFRVRLGVPESFSTWGYNVAEPHTFDLTSNFPAVLGLQQDQATITSGNYSNWVTLEGLSPGQARITVSGNGLDPRTSPNVEVTQ